MEIGVHIIVEGLVQGVGFRWFIARKAEGLGLRGYAKNLYNGNVEIEVAGERSLVEELIKEIKVGPRSAQVTNLKIEWQQPGDEYTHFEIR
ncbi:MAG TPA: acylphosphatase [Bacteroidota bacterium]|nr:acylphosphatase [Bacteroidota bacterium]